MAVTRYQVQIGNEIIEFEGPDNLSNKQIEHLADTHLRTAKPGTKLPPSVFAGTFAKEATPEGEDLPNIYSPEDSSAAGAFIRNLPHYAYGNWDDELAAAGNAAIPGLAALERGVYGDKQKSMYGDDAKGFWDTFNQNMADYRQQQQADDQLHPTASATARITGLVGTAPLVARTVAARIPTAVKELMAARPILTTVGIGGATGGISAAGEGEGNRKQSAAIGTMVGAGLGPAAYAAGELIPAVAHYARVFLGKGTTQEALSQIVKSLRRDGFDVVSPTGVQKLKTALQEFTGKPVSLADLGSATRSRAGVGLRAPSSVQQQSIDRIQSRQAGQGQRLATDIRANIAPRIDVHALNDDLVAQRAAEAEKLREAALYEQGRSEKQGAFSSKVEVDNPETGQVHSFRYTAPNGEEVTGTLAFHPEVGEGELVLHGPKGDVSNQNFSEGAGRIGLAATRDLMRQIKQNFPQIESIFGSRVSGARVRAGARTAPVQIPVSKIASTSAGGRQSRMVDDPELQQLAHIPLAQRAMQAATKQATAERDILAAQGKDISHLPDVEAQGAQLDMRSFDYLKRYLDDEVNRLYKGKESTFKAAELQQVKALRDTIREKLKTYNPEYADYLNAYKGSSEMIDSLEAGQSFDHLAPEQIAKEQAARSTAGQELYRTGTARNLLDKIRETKDTGNAASRILNSDEARAQLAATGVPPANVANLNRSVQQERVLNLLPREMAGSDTAARQVAAADADANLDHIVPIIPGNPFAWAGMMGRKFLNHASMSRMAAVNEEALPRLIETDPVAVNRIIKELEDQGNIAAARELRRQVLTRKITGIGSVAVGGSVALPEED